MISALLHWVEFLTADTCAALQDGGTRGVQAIVSRYHPQAIRADRPCQSGLKQLKQSETYATIGRHHLMR